MLWSAPDLGAGFERGPWAEQAGYDDLWLPAGEGMADPIALGAATRKIRLATGIVPVFNRPPPVLATGVVAVERLAPGRFVLGLGTSTRNMVDRWYGVPCEKAHTRTLESVALLRSILGGEKTDFTGATVRSQGFRLRELAAMGAPMFELAGEIADGVVLSDLTPVDRLPWALERIDAGAKRSGRRADDLEIVRRRALRVTKSAADSRDALESFRNVLAFCGSAPAYQQALIALDYRDAVEEIRADYEGGVDTMVVSPQGKDASTWARSADAFAAAQFTPPH